MTSCKGSSTKATKTTTKKLNPNLKKKTGYVCTDGTFITDVVEAQIRQDNIDAHVTIREWANRHCFHNMTSSDLYEIIVDYGYEIISQIKTLQRTE